MKTGLDFKSAQFDQARGDVERTAGRVLIGFWVLLMNYVDKSDN